MFSCPTTSPRVRLAPYLRCVPYHTLRGIIHLLDNDLSPPALEQSGSRRLGNWALSFSGSQQFERLNLWTST